MTREVTQIHPQAAQLTAAQATDMTGSWAAFTTQPIRDAAEYRDVVQGIDALTEPPRKEWIMARVASLLSQYYAADIPQSLVKIMAEDWAAELGRFPEWSIEVAVRWWKSAANPDRKRKPLEGDIAARCNVEFGVVKVARLAVRRYDNGTLPPTAEPERKPVDKAAAQSIMEAAGYAPKRFGGDA